MESQKIYQMGKLMLQRPRNDAFITGSPDKVFYECQSKIEAEISLLMPCRVIAIARYKFSCGFSMSGSGFDTYDILFVKEGSISVSNNVDCHIVSKNETIMIRSCDNFKVTQNEPLDIIVLRVSGFLASSYYDIITGKALLPIYIENADDMIQLFEKIVYYSTYPSNANNVFIAHTMSSIFVEIYMNRISAAGARNSKYSHPQWFVQTLDFIENNYGTDITVESLASRIFMSESYFYKIFKEYTGISPYQYLTKVRVKQAETLLNTTKLQVKYISNAVGFKSVNHFISHFKKQTGMTPIEYRKNKNGFVIL